MKAIRIPYKPDKMIFLLIVIAFSVCAGILGRVALTNKRGLVINHFFELSPTSASWFYGVLFSLALAFVLVGLMALVKSFFSKKVIVITETKLSSPRSFFSNHIVSVNFSQITAMDLRTIQRNKILHIEYNGGKLSIPQNMLPNQQAFKQLVSLIEARLPGSGTQNSHQ